MTTEPMKPSASRDDTVTGLIAIPPARQAAAGHCRTGPKKLGIALLGQRPAKLKRRERVRWASSNTSVEGTKAIINLLLLTGGDERRRRLDNVVVGRDLGQDPVHAERRADGVGL